jgi:hypothetical protein
MESGPSKIVEALVAGLLPPAAREEVLGDLRERHQSSARYLLEAAPTVPCVIYSRICRTTDAVVALMEALSMYTAFVMAAWWLNRPLLLDQHGLARLAIPPTIILAAVILADAYSHPRRRWPLKTVFGPALGLAFAYLAQSMLKQAALPTAVFASGSAMSLLLVSTLRLMFPPIPDRPQSAHAPAYWQKLELLPLPAALGSALLPGAIVLAVLLYLIGR